MAWSYWLQVWLQSLARQKVEQQVVDAVRRQVTGGATAGGSPGCDAQPAVCQVGVVFALGTESGRLEDMLSGTVTTRGAGFTVREGTLGSRRVAVVRSGAGRALAAAATSALISGHAPRLVISAGFAGGLSPELRSGDLVLGTAVQRAGADPRPLSIAAVPLPLRAWPRVVQGPLLTVDHVVQKPADKRRLGAAHRALAVDMETAAVAEVCQDLGVPLLAVRVIIDPVDQQLPADVETLLHQKTTVARLGAALGAFTRRPGSAMDLLQLKQSALDASDRLAKFLAQLIAQTPAGSADPA